MRRNKRWLLLVTLVLILSSTACGSEPTAAPEGVAEPAATPITEEGVTPQPAATPMQEGEARFQLLDYNVFLDPRRDLTIVGIIENSGDGDGQPVPGPIRLADASGNVVVEPSLFSTLELIAPGQKAPFVTYVFEYEGVPENWQDLEVRLEEESYSVDMIVGEPIRMEAEGLASHAFEAQAEGEPGIYGVSGWIANHSGSPAESLTVFVAGYDAGGKVVDVVLIWDLVDYLNPGMRAPFISTLSMVRPIVSYEVFAEGQVVEPRNVVEMEIAEYTVIGPDEHGGMEFLGEVVNAGSALALETEIVIALVTAQGEVLDIGSTTGSSIALAPGDRLPFKISAYLAQDLEDLWDGPEFLVQGFAEDSLSDIYTGVYTDLKLEGLDTLAEEYGRYRLTGQITNTGGSKANVDVVAALYDAEGKVIDFSSGYVVTLEPGDSQALDLNFRSVGAEGEVASFKVFYGGLASKY